MALFSKTKCSHNNGYRSSVKSVPDIKQILHDALVSKASTLLETRFQSVADLLEAERGGSAAADQHADQVPKSSLSKRLSSTIPSVDTFLLGGFKCGSIVEVCGMPSTGKTCFAYMLSCAGLMTNLSENEVVVAFIDFALKFSTNRLLEIMQNRSSTLSHAECELKLNAMQYMRIRPDSQVAVDQAVEKLAKLAESNNVQLVVIDALDFGLWMRGIEQRIRIMLHRLSRLAMKFGFVVVVNTHSRTWSRSFWHRADADGQSTANDRKVEEDEEEARPSVCTRLETVHSTLPDDLSSLFSHRILLVKGRQYNTLRVTKNPTGQSAAFLYNIDAGGFALFGEA